MLHRLLALASLLCLTLPASASATGLRRTAPPRDRARAPRIVNGTEAGAGEYPAQAALYIDADDNGGADHLCGGTLVGSRQVLTAAHCAVDAAGAPLLARDFFVYLGVLNQNDFPKATPHAVAGVDVNADHDVWTNRSDTAMLTLSHPASFEPARVVEPGDEPLWKPATVARIVGWGTTAPRGYTSDLLLEADVPIVADAACGDAYGAEFDPGTMVCAGDPVGTTAPHDTCQGDSGGPLYVPDRGSTPERPVFATAGVVSWGRGCGNPAYPGVYARIGDGPLNAWTLARVPRADYELDHAPRAGEPVTFTSTSTDPEGDGYFTAFGWDADADGGFDDASGETVELTFGTPGEHVVGLEASRPDGDRASVYYAFDVEPGPEGGGGEPGTDSGGTDTGGDDTGGTDTGGRDDGAGGGSSTGTTGGTGGAGGVAQALRSAPRRPRPRPNRTVGSVATFRTPRTLRVHDGRFRAKLRFPASARPGTAAVSVLLAGRKIGSGRISITPGRTAVARIDLTRAGVRRLRHAKRLKATLRLRGRDVAGDKRLILRR